MAGIAWTSAAAAAFLFAFAAAALAQAPSVGTVTPSVTSAYPSTYAGLIFTATYSPSTVYPELDVAMNNQVGGVNGCFFVFFQNSTVYNTPTLYLFDDNAQYWYPVRLGTSDSAQNSHCRVTGQGAGSSYDSGSLSVTAMVSFFSSWAGATLQYFEQAVDDGEGGTSGWWQNPEASFLVLGDSQGAPSLGTVTSSGSGPPNTAENFVFTDIDPNGWQAIHEMDVVISPNHSGGNACFFVFFPYLSTVYLFDDNVQYWWPVGLNSTDSSGSWNSSCAVLGPNSSYTGLNGAVGNTGALTLNLTFTSNLQGTNYYDEQLSDQFGGVAGWGTLPGTFVVTPPPTLTQPGDMAVTVGTNDQPVAFSKTSARPISADCCTRLSMRPITSTPTAITIIRRLTST